MVTCSGFSPAAAAAFAWSMVWNWHPAQISHLSGLKRAHRGERLHRRVREVRELELPLDAFRGTRQRRLDVPAFHDRHRLLAAPHGAVLLHQLGGAALLRTRLVPGHARAPRGPSSPTTCRARRPPRRAGICTTSTTPGTAFALVASNELTLPPKRGGRMTTAVIIPGSITSMANCCLPVDFARLSSRGSFSLPTMLEGVPDP